MLQVTVTDAEALDAYSQVVTSVAERLGPSVANLRMRRGGGSGGVITPDRLLLSHAHVVHGARRGRPRAAVPDGRDVAVDVIGADPLSDLAVLRAEGAGFTAAELG